MSESGGLLVKMIEDICGEDLFNSIITVLLKNPFTDFGESISTMIKTIYDIAMSVAVMLMFVYFLLALVDKMTSENFSWDQVWRQMALLLAAKMLMEHGYDLLKLMSDVGIELISMITAGISDITGLGIEYNAAGEIVGFKVNVWGGDATAKSLLDNYHVEFGFGILSGIYNLLSDALLFVQLILPWLFSWIMRIAMKIICYTRLIEIYVRAAFAPIALSDFFKNGFQGGGWRYLKSFLAVCLQGALILCIAVMFATLCQELLDPTETSLFTFIGYYFAFGCSALMLMFKSLGLTKDIMGVN
ncbi:MAG: hypothetical protein IJ411_02105 [Oscillospiraceae bacterium]|nr:hypothetical protein [Oscillospiraceae bacterium]